MSPTSSQKDLKALIESAGFAVIGQRIRRIRTRGNMTIRELADKAQISKNTLLSLEQGHPTHISTIKVICKALKMKPEELAGKDFIQPSVVAVQRKADLVWYDMNTFDFGHTNVPLSEKSEVAPNVTPFSHLESRCLDKRVVPHLIDLRNATPFRSHRGEEFVYVVSGSARITVGTQAYDLVEGDSICFWAAESHSYEPIGDGGPARLLSIVIDPFQKLLK